MKIGTFIIEIYGEHLFPKAVEHFISSMDNTFRTVSDQFQSDYRRFGFYAAVIKFIVPLKVFWRGDYFYNSLIKNLNYCFRNWQFDITLTIYERSP